MGDVIRILLLADTHLGFDLPVNPRVNRRRRGHDFLANYAAALQPALTGEVADITVKNKAEASAKVEGIKSVDNKLTLKPAPTPAPPSPDKMLEGTINEALKKKNITGVTVSVSNGEVTLSGTVDKAKVPEVMMAANESKPAKVINNLNK